MTIPAMLGSYPVERELGRGGMGVVYLARDPRLNRQVAIKIVPEALAANPDNMARFEREARLLAAVNHPNIASIYSVEDVNGQRLLVMEYIAGESLADRLMRGPLPVTEALDVARQIAAAVEAAHEGGIVHRDLKPGNVRVTPDGTVKVLDFGLAKGLVTSDAELAQSPTLTYSPTGLGVILGTAGYMSPEQARGKPVDRRADVWAFGCVLYECLAGKKTFEGETVSDTIARILEREPPWTDLPAATPLRIRELLRRCLEKDLKKRQRDMGDVRLEIEEALANRSSSSSIGPTTGSMADVPMTRRGLSPALIAATSLIVGAAAGIGLWNLAGPSPRAAGATPVSLSVTMPSSLHVTGWSFPRGTDDFILIRGIDRRPDGTEDSSGRVFYRRLGSFELTPVPGSEGTSALVESPDGRAIIVNKQVSAQSADFRLVRLSIDGSSPPLPVAEWDPAWSDLIWLSDGDLLIQTAGTTKFFRLSAAGGAAKPPIAFDFGGAGGYPQFNSEVPGGGVLMKVSHWTPQGYQEDTWLLDPGTGKAHKLIDNSASAVYVPSIGCIVFSRGPAVMAVRFDPRAGSISGDAVGVFEGLRTNLWSNGDFSLSEKGSLLFEPGGRLGTDRRLVTVNAAHEVVPFLTDARAYESSLSTTRDGKQVGVVIPNPRGTYETWIGAADQPGLRRALSYPGADATAAVWSPDNRWLAFERNGRDKDDGVYVRLADGSNDPRAVFKIDSDEEGLSLQGWNQDGTAVIVVRAKGATQQTLIVPVAATPTGAPAAPKVLLTTKAGNRLARLSPDGHYLAYVSDESGSFELHVAEIAGDTIVGRPLVVTSGGVGPNARWSADSKRLYFMKAPARVMSVTVERTPSLHVTSPVFVQDLTALRMDPATWDVLPDGRLLAIQLGAGEEETKSYSVVLNWLDLVRGKLPK